MTESPGDVVSDYIKVLAYDTKGRLSRTVTSLGVNGADGDYAEYQTYDQYGRPFQTIDATAKGIRYVYNTNGHLEKLVEASNTSKIYHQVTQTNARGQVTGETMMGGAFQMARGYSPQTGLASTIMATSSQYSATPSGSTLLDISLSFDAVGNLSTRSRQVKATSSLAAHTLSETFSYDQLNRLTQIAATGHATQNLTYDITGNILTKTGISGTYAYGANGAGPHAVTSAGGNTYTYDAIGNMLTGDGRTAVYNAFRKPTSLTKGSNTTTFAYGPDRSHYKRVDNNGTNVTTTITVGSVEFIKVDSNPVTSKRYIGGVAVISDSTATGHEEHVLLTDHLGSTVAIAKHTALELQQMDYDAFGKRRNLWDLTELAQADKTTLNKLTTKGFTGHEMVDGVGVIHMKGRVYDPKLGRFLSADPYITELDNTQNMNRYSYVYNNPLTLVDPNGFSAAPSCGGCYQVTVTAKRSSGNDVGNFLAFDPMGRTFLPEDLSPEEMCFYSGTSCDLAHTYANPANADDTVTEANDPGKVLYDEGLAAMAKEGQSEALVKLITDLADGIIDAANPLASLMDCFQNGCSKTELFFAVLEVLPQAKLAGKTADLMKVIENSFPNSALVVRGGGATNHTPALINDSIGPSRTEGISGFSVQCNGGTCLGELGQHLPNTKVGVTTVGEIRLNGGDVIATPGKGHHATVTNIRGDAASPLFTNNIMDNPNPRGR